MKKKRSCTYGMTKSKQGERETKKVREREREREKDRERVRDWKQKWDLLRLSAASMAANARRRIFSFPSFLSASRASVQRRIHFCYFHLEENFKRKKNINLSMF
jgi:hypothetical protein